MGILITLLPYLVPVASVLFAAWTKWKGNKAVDLLTTAIEIVNTKEVKELVAELSKGTKMEGVIEKSLDRLDKAGIAAYIRDNKK